MKSSKSVIFNYTGDSTTLVYSLNEYQKQCLICFNHTVIRLELVYDLQLSKKQHVSVLQSVGRLRVSRHKIHKFFIKHFLYKVSENTIDPLNFN